MSKKVKVKKDAPKKEEPAAVESTGLELEGSMRYLIIVGDDLDVRYEQSNENNLVSFIAVQNTYEELWNEQMNLGSPDRKMSKDEIKELQISKNFLRKHIAMLGAHVQAKYKNGTPEKSVIETVSPLAAMKEMQEHDKKKKK
jgi:hypothetical protein